jgi:PPK2 family polyphosphate:nucleotide phosphotransferase
MQSSTNMNHNNYRIPYDGSYKLKKTPTGPDNDKPTDKKLKKLLAEANDKLYKLQRCLYAHNRHAVLLVFQAMDAAGKDSTIRHVMRGVNPAGCQVFAFKQPSKEELEHDFLWRSAMRLPERGRIGIFNRSYYEETLVVRVHPEYLSSQNLPGDLDLKTIWHERFQSIREHESHLASNGTKIIKFWLNVSKEEQKQRFLQRIDNPAKNWKFSKTDVKERGHWNDYMSAYQEMLNETSRPNAPWFAIPADNKPYARLMVANTIVEAIESLDCKYPEALEENRVHFDDMKQQLLSED